MKERCVYFSLLFYHHHHTCKIVAARLEMRISAESNRVMVHLSRLISWELAVLTVAALMQVNHFRRKRKCLMFQSASTAQTCQTESIFPSLWSGNWLWKSSRYSQQLQYKMGIGVCIQQSNKAIGYKVLTVVSRFVHR